MFDEAKRRVREQLGWEIAEQVCDEGSIPVVIIGELTRPATLEEVQAYNALLSTTEQLLASQERVKKLETMLGRAVDKLWFAKNGLMGLRESTELSPTKEEWCAELLAALAEGTKP